MLWNLAEICQLRLRHKYLDIFKIFTKFLGIYKYLRFFFVSWILQFDSLQRVSILLQELFSSVVSALNHICLQSARSSKPFMFWWCWCTKSRAIIGQRGRLLVRPLGYLNFKKVIFRTMRTMRKQFPVVLRTTHWCVYVLTRNLPAILKFGNMESQKRPRSEDNDTSVSKTFPRIAIPNTQWNKGSS